MSRLLLGTLITLMAVSAEAHKIKIFSHIEIDKILGQVYFVGGKPAAGLAVSLAVENQVNRVEKTDTDGRFIFVDVEPDDYRVIADAGEGHIAHWAFSRDEFSTIQTSTSEGVSEKSALSTAHEKLTEQSADSVTLDRVLLERLIEEAVARQVARQTAPLREDINTYSDQVKLGDTLGGIGYIIGLFGIYAWWRSRK